MGNFDIKIEKFLKAFIDNGGYHNVLTGLKNTMEIAIIGLLIGIAIGTLIASIRVLPKYRTHPRVLDKICSFYVAIFRGTPMVVQLLVFYYVLMPLMGIKIDGLNVAITVFGLNSGAYVSEIMRGGILSVDPGQLEGGRSVGMSYATTMFKIVIPQAIRIFFRPSATSSSRLSRKRQSFLSSEQWICIRCLTISEQTTMNLWCRTL